MSPEETSRRSTAEQRSQLRCSMTGHWEPVEADYIYVSKCREPRRRWASSSPSSPRFTYYEGVRESPSVNYTIRLRCRHESRQPIGPPSPTQTVDYSPRELHSTPTCRRHPRRCRCNQRHCCCCLLCCAALWVFNLDNLTLLFITTVMHVSFECWIHYLFINCLCPLSAFHQARKAGRKVDLIRGLIHESLAFLAPPTGQIHV